MSCIMYYICLYKIISSVEPNPGRGAGSDAVRGIGSAHGISSAHVGYQDDIRDF